MAQRKSDRRAGEVHDADGGDLDKGDRIARMVAGNQTVGGLLLIGVMAVCFGVPAASGVLCGHPILGIANALLLGLVGWGIVLLIHLVVLPPISMVRYGRAQDCERGGRTAS